MNEIDRFKKQYILYAKRGSVLKLKPGRKIYKALNNGDTEDWTNISNALTTMFNDTNAWNNFWNNAQYYLYNDSNWNYNNLPTFTKGNLVNNYGVANENSFNFNNAYNDPRWGAFNKLLVNNEGYRNGFLTKAGFTSLEGNRGALNYNENDNTWSLNPGYTLNNTSYGRKNLDSSGAESWEAYFLGKNQNKGTRNDKAFGGIHFNYALNLAWDSEKKTLTVLDNTDGYEQLTTPDNQFSLNPLFAANNIWVKNDKTTLTPTGDSGNSSNETSGSSTLTTESGTSNLVPGSNINFTPGISQGKKWNFWPEIGWLGLTLLSNKANNDIAEILHKGVRPKLHIPYEFNRPIRDKYNLVLNAYGKAADKMYATAQNYLTSDASLQFAKLRETAKDVDADIDEKRLESDEYVEKTRLELQEAREQSIKNRNKVANENMDELVDTRLKHALIDAQNREDKAENWDKFLGAINTELYQNREEKRNNNLSYSAEALKNEYSTLQNQLEQYYLNIYGLNANGDITKIGNTLYLQFLRDLNMLSNFYKQEVGKLANGYNTWSWPSYDYSVKDNNNNSYSNWYDWFKARIGANRSASKKQGGKLTPKPKFKKGGKPALIFNKKKFLSGGVLSNPFVRYFTTTNITIPKTSGASSSSVSTKSSKKSDDELSEKDIFKLFEKIEGLPNEMVEKVNKFKKILQYHNITGGNITSLASLYLNETVDFQILKQNKAKFDAAYKTVQDNGALGEVAVTSNGQFYAYRKGGNKKNQRKRFVTITPEEYYKHKNSYSLVTNLTLAWLRLYEPPFTYDLSIFEVLNSSVGYQSFQDMLSKASITLGSVSRQISGNSVVEGDVDAAAKGMAILQSLDANDRAVLLTSMIDSGLGNYKWTKLNKTDLLNVYAYVNYLILVLPANVKTWATTKTNLTDPNKATAKLVTDYLMGRTSMTNNFNVTYSAFKDDDVKGKSGKSAASAMDKLKQGLMTLILLGIGGDLTTFNILKGKTLLSVNARYYGMIEGMKMGYQPLDLYLEESRLAMIKGSAKITFGDQVLSNYKDVVIDGSGGIVIATLPKNSDGTVNFQLLEEFTKMTNKLTEEGLHPGDELYNLRLGEELKNNSTFTNMVTANGKLNSKFFGLFAMVNAVASDKTRVREHGKAGNISLGDSGSEWFENNDELADDLIMALTPDKDREYNFDKNDLPGEGWPYEKNLWHSYDRVYTGVLYIPINNNLINGNNADENDMEASAAHQYEQDKLNWNKRLTAGSTSSEALNFNNE